MKINIHKWMKNRLTLFQSQNRSVCNDKRKNERGLSTCIFCGRYYSNVSAACLVPSDRVVKFASKMKANATDEQALQLKKKFLDEEFQ